MNPLVMGLLGKIAGGIMKFLPFLAAFKFGGDREKAKQQKEALKEMVRGEKIEEDNKSKSNVTILNELRDDD